MDKSCRHRGALCGSTTRLLSEASEILLQDTLPSSADLQELINWLRDKDTALAELDKKITDALDGEESDAEIVGTLDYHEKIVKAISRLRSAINARAPVGSAVFETNQRMHAEYAAVLQRVLMRSLPENLAIQYLKRMKTEIDAADSVVQSRDEQVKAILKFLQGEGESREESRASLEKNTSGRPSTNRKAADTVIPSHLPSALALTARSSSPGADSRPGQTICPLCGISGHVTRDCRVALSAEEKRQRLSSKSSCFSATALFLACSDDWCTEVLPGDPSEIWRLDAIGITDGQDDISKHPALLHFRSTVCKSAGRYVVPLIIKTSGLMSCTNRSVAEIRLNRQLQRLEHHPEVLQEYHATISEYFKEGHAERVAPSAPLGQTVYYLPHNPVVRREAVTTKVCVVFDASSHEYREPSLNDVLDKGINSCCQQLCSTTSKHGRRNTRTSPPVCSGRTTWTT
ncbi:hypothetical protein MTO96_018110 [Rhipicephalus appendiculatus]